MVQLGLGQWYRRRRRRRAFKKNPDLREFVYLDDVSVFSLIASQLGPVATEFTTSETQSLQGEVSGTVGANLGIKRAEASTRAQADQSHTSQVVRRSIVQNTFADLRDHVTSKDLALSTEVPDLDTQVATSASTLDELKRRAPRCFVDVDLIKRGQLIEVDVELEADPIFKVNAAMAAVLEIVQESPQAFGDEVITSMADARAMQKIIDRLLTGLVPIRGRLVDYCILDLGGDQRIVRRELADAIEPGGGAVIRPLYLVGVASESLFWKDVRLVLFSRSRHRVMCRLRNDGTQDRWTASKLVEVLASTFPQLGDQLDRAIDAALAALDAATGQSVPADERETRVRSALILYGEAVAATKGHRLVAEDLAAMGVPRTEDVKRFSDLAGRRLAFNSIAEAVAVRFGLDLDHTELAALRSASLSKAGLDPTGALVPVPSSSSMSSTGAAPQMFIEADFVAIYW
jgi:hypothetical protein